MGAVATPGFARIRTAAQRRPSRERASHWTCVRDKEGDALTDLRPWTEEDEEVLRQRLREGLDL